MSQQVKPEIFPRNGFVSIDIINQGDYLARVSASNGLSHFHLDWEARLQLVKRVPLPLIRQSRRLSQSLKRPRELSLILAGKSGSSTGPT
jgi:hypothetical protein